MRKNLTHIRDAIPSVRLVSAADKLHNAQTILKDYRRVGDGIWERFKGGKEGTLWYYRSLVDEFRAVEPLPLVDELDRVVKEIEKLVGIFDKSRQIAAPDAVESRRELQLWRREK